MKTIMLLNAVFAAACILASLSTSVHAKHVTIVPDVSGSNPLLTNEHINAQASAYVELRMRKVDAGDVVTLRFMGSLSNPKALQKHEYTISYQNKAMVKQFMSQVVLAMPAHTKPQNSTNLIAFLGRYDFGCADGGEIIILTDGIEASEYVDGKALLSGKASLPKPSASTRLKGCTIIFYGIGAGRSDAEFQRLRIQWQQYFDSAGATFKAIAL
ncbi:MAG: hypothetical protein ABJH28_05160 [Paraglaciecola sp.]|uniref:hypothetical protein n=1 Tax=Paraglaciecola sp. TaxID=1920173 RepID=UPI003267C87D